MPYNSSAFEKQLAKYKAAEAVKKAADMPRLKDDPHQIRSRVAPVRGEVQPNTITSTQLMGDGAQTVPVLREEQRADANAGQTVIIVQKQKKPLYLRGWFMMMVLSLFSMALTPVVFKEQWQELRDMIGTVKSTTGVDPLSITTYTNMMKGQPVVGQPPVQTHTDIPADPTDMNAVMQQVQDRTNAITSQGAAQSMQYIEEETKRLQDMARQLQEESGVR